MGQEYKTCILEAIQAAKLLFDRNKVSGASGNLSFRHEGKIYISGSGTCFGWLTEEDFAVIDQDGQVISSKKPSKEFPLHKEIYDARPEANAVIHTHSFYSVLMSCLYDETRRDVFSDITPYLKMRVGTIGMIPRATPGSEELFQMFRERLWESDGYLLANHGPVIWGRNIKEAFFGLEELEETAKIHYYLNLFKGENENGKIISDRMGPGRYYR